VSESKAVPTAWRLIVIVLCFCASPLVFGQSPPTRTQTKPPVNESRGVIRPQDLVVIPQTSTVPLLFGMNRNQVARVLEPLRLQPKFSGPDDGIALEQKPLAGTKVPYGSGVAVTLGLMPGLVLNGPAAPAYAGSELPFRVSFVPPLPAGLKPIYQFTWGDGSPVESTTKTVLTHRFADAGARVVSVIWTLDDRVKIGSARVAVDVLPPPTAQTSVVPLLFGMNRNEVARVLKPLQLQPKFSGAENGIALEQKPEAGTKVPYGSGIAVTLGLMPGLVLNGPAAPAYAGSELTFRVAFVPPLPAGPKPIYQFTWGDGSPVESTTKAVITHRFADAGARVVSVIWTLDDRVKIGSARVDVDILPAPAQTSVVPSLFGMNRNEVMLVLKPLQLQPKFSGVENGIALDQKPEAGTKVRYGSGVAVMLGEMPRLVLNGPAAPAYAGSELTFTAAFVPPLPAGPKVGYFFTWGDGSPIESTGNAVVTHRFADAGNRVVSVTGVINDRFKTVSRVPVEILPPPQTDTTPSTPATTSDTTDTVATEGTTATETTTTPESTTSSVTTTTAPTTTTEPATTTTTTTETAPTPNPLPNPLVWIGAAAVVLLLVVTFLLARVLRALNRKPSEQQVQAKSPVFHGGMRPIEYEIEHPELIRRGPTVGLRGGIRGEGDGDV
jgi:hypothetical protein